MKKKGLRYALYGTVLAATAVPLLLFLFSPIEPVQRLLASPLEKVFLDQPYEQETCAFRFEDERLARFTGSSLDAAIAQAEEEGFSCASWELDPNWRICSKQPISWPQEEIWRLYLLVDEKSEVLAASGWKARWSAFAL